ncbi:MAG TPA: cation:proton antiporter [Sandaracinaceae bacterium LLY-WYZ-13_1]|nr:cation:proton antiporter [Sandaracinaceae bacterium LLY-WYZ-13_1]
MPARSPEGWTLLLLGAFLLLGFVAHVAGRRAHVPRVTLLLLVGVLAGPSGLDLVPEAAERWFPLVSRTALTMIGFLLGQHFKWKVLERTGRAVVTLSLVESAAAALAVLGVLWAAGIDPVVALLFAAVAPATAPAATLDVIRESGARGPVSKTVLRVVAIDDVWGVILFSVLLVAAHVGSGDGGALEAVLHGAWEIAGAVLLGVGLGLPMAWLSGRVRGGHLTLVETLGFVLLAAGAAQLAGTSYLITSMVLGAVVANAARHHRRVFHAIEDVMEPFLIVFFLLAGFEFELDVVWSMSLGGLLYVLARSAGKVAGASLGARLARLRGPARTWVGLCLLPQAGVALGLGLMIRERHPEAGATVLSTLVATTVLFELFGPLVTRFALARAGETEGARGETSA